MRPLKCILFATAAVLSAACQPDTSGIVENPTPEHIAGFWESTDVHPELPYALIKFDETGNGIMVAGNSIAVSQAARLQNFTSFEKFFTIELVLSDPDTQEGSEIILLNANLQNDRLCASFAETNDTGPEIDYCFIRLEKADEYRALAKAIFKDSNQ